MTQAARTERLAVFSIPVVLCVLLLILVPAYLTNPLVMGGLILIEIVFASLWHFESVYLPLLMAIFIWGGSLLPFSTVGLSARWLVLGVGAVAGSVLWMRGNKQSFTILHLAALFCVSSAFVTALVSNDPWISLLKVGSLGLLFLYGSTGARLALPGRETMFIRGLVSACEGIVYGTALCYAAGFPLWGNPNSLGAVMGVVMLPMMVWAFLAAESRSQKHRRLVAILVCVILIYTALSRASILAAVVSVGTLCVCLRKQRILIEGAFLVVLVIAIAAVVEPQHFDQSVQTVAGALLYKNKKGNDILGSRRSPWQETVNSLREHPWFGTGFGTSDITPQGEAGRLNLESGVYTREGSNREHGNSYLALAEYVGILGLIPFSFLLFLVVRLVVRVGRYMRRTSNPQHPAIPLAMFMLGALIHAFFEDWLVAVGYYLCTFFWIAAFLTNDLLPEDRPLRLPTASPAHPDVSAPIPSFVTLPR